VREENTNSHQPIKFRGISHIFSVILGAVQGMSEAPPALKKFTVPHMGMLNNFPVKYLRQRAMVGSAKGGTQTRMIREGNETMRYHRLLEIV
jgi:hypothetical protein